MEEVDGIIIHTLRSIGCDIEDDVMSLHQFSTELTVESTARCIKTINSEMEIPSKLPPSMSAKFRVGSLLAKALQDLGYRGEVGYQTFLYSNEADLRKVFIFLVEKLPKESATSQEENLSTSAVLQRSIGNSVRKSLERSWTPPFCSSKNVKYGHRTCTLSYPRGLQDVTTKVPKPLRTYYNSTLPVVDRQPMDTFSVVTSLLETNSQHLLTQQEWEAEWNRQGLASRLSQKEYKARKKQKLDDKLSGILKQSLKEDLAVTEKSQNLGQLVTSLGSSRDSPASRVKGSRFTHAEKLQFAQDEEKAAAQISTTTERTTADTEEEVEQQRQEEVSRLTGELAEVNTSLETLQLDTRKTRATIQQCQEQLEKLLHENKQMTDAYQIKKKTVDLLPDAANNIAKLQELVDTSTQRLVTLANQWEKHRVPLIEQYRELKAMSSDRQVEVDDKLTRLQELRTRLKDAAAETRSKDEVLKQVREEYQNMTKDVNRTAYTKRILEIVSNIKKQKQQIDQVLIDTKTLQKDINSLTGKLDRTFTVTDEVIFRDAKRDEVVRKAYKSLAALHQNCSAVILTVEETGVILREIRDLEDQVDNESKQNTAANLDRISVDLRAMRGENAGLMDRLKRQA